MEIIATEREMSLCYPDLEQLAQEHGDSFYILNVQQLRGNYCKISNAFTSRYSNFVLGYSYKTNYLPYLCKKLEELGAYAEVVSRLEYDLAMKLGVNPRKIIFNGPLKSKSDIQYAINNGSKVNLDSFYEIEYVKDYCLKHPNEQVKIGLRVNFDLSEDGESPLVEAYPISRFGICVENGDLRLAIESLIRLDNLTISGLHGHFSTGTRRVETFEKITRTLCMLAKDYDLQELEYIDIGGGIFGEVPESLIKNVPSFEDYADAICSIMNEQFPDEGRKPALILEPGISMTANTFVFAAKAVSTKKIRDTNFVLADGSVHNIKPTMHKKNLPMKILKHPERKEAMIGTYHITGYTCLEKDYLASDYYGEIPEAGDFILFENVGAYTIVFSPSFIKEKPAIIAVDHDQIVIARKKESIKQFFNEELYYF